MLENYTHPLKRMLSELEPICRSYAHSKFFFLWDALKCRIRYGVTPHEYVSWSFFKKSHLERSEFYTARHCGIWEKRLNNVDSINVFNQKELTLARFKDYIKRDWLYAPDHTPKEIEAFIQSHNKLIVKPNNLSSGRGIHVLREKENTKDLINYNCLLEEFISQHPDISQFNHSSVNTIRVYSIKPFNDITISELNQNRGGVYKNGNTLIISASIRIGGKGAEADNFHAGGVGYPIDVKSGIICGAGINFQGERFLIHPSSGLKVIGFEIPNWNKLLEYIYSLNQVVDDVRMIAWDIAVTPDGFEMIEANHDGNPDLMQGPIDKGFKRLIKQCL